MSSGRKLAMAAALAGAAAANVASADDLATALPIIDIERNDNGIQIAAGALAVTAAELTGEVVINRTGRSGTVSTRQSRQLDLAAGETGYIARNGISFGAGDEIEVRVILKDGDVLVAEASVVSR